MLVDGWLSCATRGWVALLCDSWMGGSRVALLCDSWMGGSPVRLVDGWLFCATCGWVALLCDSQLFNEYALLLNEYCQLFNEYFRLLNIGEIVSYTTGFCIVLLWVG